MVGRASEVGGDLSEVWKRFEKSMIGDPFVLAALVNKFTLANTLIESLVWIMRHARVMEVKAPNGGPDVVNHRLCNSKQEIQYNTLKAS